MTAVSRRAFLLWATALAPLSACDEALMAAGPEFAPLDYSARQDGRHVIPAVPIDRVPEVFRRQLVRYDTDEAPGSIVVELDNALLYLILENGRALRYGIGVGRAGLGWRGRSRVYRTAHWPTWTPTANMIRRDPSLARWAGGQAGGPRNPLGARALYLRNIRTGRDHGIRIHGTPQWQSIGRRASAGCFRMINHDVIDLYGRVEVGALVVVV